MWCAQPFKSENKTTEKLKSYSGPMKFSSQFRVEIPLTFHLRVFKQKGRSSHIRPLNSLNPLFWHNKAIIYMERSYRGRTKDFILDRYLGQDLEVGGQDVYTSSGIPNTRVGKPDGIGWRVL